MFPGYNIDASQWAPMETPPCGLFANSAVDEIVGLEQIGQLMSHNHTDIHMQTRIEMLNTIQLIAVHMRGNI
jgi:hypothetical protein